MLTNRQSALDARILEFYQADAAHEHLSEKDQVRLFNEWASAKGKNWELKFQSKVPMVVLLLSASGMIGVAEAIGFNFPEAESVFGWLRLIGFVGISVFLLCFRSIGPRVYEREESR